MAWRGGPAPPPTPASPPSPPQEMVHWFNALRAARFHYLQVAFPGASDADVSGCCPRGPCGGLGWGLAQGAETPATDA